MTKELALRILGAAWLPFALAACGSTDLVLGSPSDSGLPDGDAHEGAQVDAQGTDGSPASLDAGARDADASHDAGTCEPPTPGAWGITMDGKSAQGCVQDSDCVAAYIGNDACEVHFVDGVQNFPCPNAAILASDSATYQAQYQAINQSCHAVCGPGSVTCSSVPVYCDKQGVAGPTCALCSSIPGACANDGGQ